MAYVMVLAHLIGDYALQWDTIARWKARSVKGVLAHGGIVTAVALACTAAVSPSWWPFALVIGVVHTVVDLIRARFLQTTKPIWEWVWFLADQAAHLATILLVVAWAGEPDGGALTWLARLPSARRWLAYGIGYLLLAQPAWVFLRLTVRALGGPHAAPPLGEGEKYGPIMERLLITSGVLLGRLYLVPLAILPRYLASYRAEEQRSYTCAQVNGRLTEAILGTLLAAAVGLILRAF